MEKIEIITNNQKSLLLLIKNFEARTRELLDCEPEQVTELVAVRQRILDKMAYHNGEILKLCPEGSPEYQAYKNSCDRDSLSEENRQIFDLRQEFNISLNRLRSMDPEIIGRLEITRDQMKEKIRENNSGQSAKAAKFFTPGLDTGQKMYFPENNRKI